MKKSASSLPALPAFFFMAGVLREKAGSDWKQTGSRLEAESGILGEAGSAGSMEAEFRTKKMFTEVKTMRQLRLFDLENHLSDMKRKAVGTAGEHVAYVLLERAGYDVAQIGRGDRRGDLLAISRETGEQWRIEVKTARRGRDRRYRWTLVKEGHTCAYDSDVVILFAALKSGRVVPFVIPCAALGGRKTVQISGHPEGYGGQWAQYRQRANALKLEGERA